MPDGIDIEFAFGDFNRLLREIERKVKGAAVPIAHEVGSRILYISNTMVPTLTGTLLSSGYYEVSTTTVGPEVIVSYGGNGDPINPLSKRRASEYFIEVHENLDAFHKNGEAKFLEKAITAYRMAMDAEINAIARKYLGW